MKVRHTQAIGMVAGGVLWRGRDLLLKTSEDRAMCCYSSMWATRPGRDARAARPARFPGAPARGARTSLRTRVVSENHPHGGWPTVRRQNMDKHHVKVCEGKAHTSNRGGGRWGDVARKTYFLRQSHVLQERSLSSLSVCCYAYQPMRYGR